MLIIIEGVDGTGKTTLAQELRRRLGDRGDTVIAHFGPPRDPPLVEYVQTLQGLLEKHDHVICDRFHLGEQIWPAVFNRPSDYTDEVHAWIELFLLSRGALLVTCSGTPSRTHARLQERGELVQRQIIDHAFLLFDGAFASTKLPKITCNIDFPGIKQPIYDNIIRQANILEWQSSHLLRISEEYVGDIRPRVLFVGDRRNLAVKPNLGLPFPPIPSSSGTFLMQAIDSWLGDREVPIGITNASVPDLKELHYHLGSPRIVALGNQADLVLRDIGIPHGTTFHPQYVRRFHANKISEYADLLRKACGFEDARDHKFITGVGL